MAAATASPTARLHPCMASVNTAEAAWLRYFRGRARYCFPARRTTVLRLTLSRTDTAPLDTFVSVPEHESCTSHFVPRTVAELYWPRVRNEPDPSPHSLRDFGFLAAALALPFLHA